MRVVEATKQLEDNFAAKEKEVEEEKAFSDRKLHDQDVKFRAMQRRLEDSQTELFQINLRAEETQHAKEGNICMR